MILYREELGTDMKGKTKLGIDLGGTKIEVLLMDDSGEILLRKRIDTPRGCYKDIINELYKIIHSIDPDGYATIGIGTPGSLSPTTSLLRGSNTTELNGMDFKGDLEKALNRPVRIANDANCFALSEAIDGAAKAYKTVFGVIIGTGTGGGLILNKRLITGHNLIAGEWGHNPLPWLTPTEYPGSSCYCGKQGCIETFLSGPAFANAYFLKTGKKCSPKQITNLAEQGDIVAQHSLNTYCDQVARALATIINTFDPAAIVLGGGMSNISLLYKDVPQILPQYCFSDDINTQILQAQHGDSSGVRGAAWLWD